jgi:hypothetical protein
MGGTERVNISYKSADLDALGVWHGNCTYNGPIIKVGTESWRPTTQLAEADFGISFGVYRQHCCHAGFLSAGIKNMIGAISQNTGNYSRVQSFHGDYNGGPGVWYKYADLFKNGMNDLVHLYISDWLFTCVDETKAMSKVTKRIVMSTDPCAIDSYAVDYYKEIGMLKSDKGAVKGVPQKLADAGVGNTAYDLVPVTIGQTTASPRLHAPSKTLTVNLWAPECRYSSAHFHVLQNERVDYIGVYDMYGRRVHAFRPQQDRRRILFDGTNQEGRLLPAGAYALRLTTTGGRAITQKLSIAR